MIAKREEELLWVWLDDPVFGPLQQIGTLSRGARGTVRFVYEPAWLKQVNAFPLDPELDLSAGDFFPGGSNFGLFMDSCPDRWGQLLMKRREAIEAKEEDRTPRALGPWDFLLGVQDCTRMGARKWWSEMSGYYELYISDAVLQELNNGNYPRKDEIIRLVSTIQLLPLALCVNIDGAT